jgi:hypothetical protein
MRAASACLPRNLNARCPARLQRYPDDRLTVILLCNSDEENIATTLARAVALMSFGD